MRWAHYNGVWIRSVTDASETVRQLGSPRSMPHAATVQVSQMLCVTAGRTGEHGVETVQASCGSIGGVVWAVRRPPFSQPSWLDATARNKTMGCVVSEASLDWCMYSGSDKGLSGLRRLVEYEKLSNSSMYVRCLRRSHWVRECSCGARCACKGQKKEHACCSRKKGPGRRRFLMR